MLHGVILAGGSGTRFWPLSRRDLPKQLLKLAGARTLLQQSFDRLRGTVDEAQIHVVTGELIAARVREQLPDLPPASIMVEPEPKDTAVAIGLAAALIHARDPDAVLAITPSDHVIRPAQKFREALREAAEVAGQRGSIVTFGIPPREPKTGFGYIRRGARLERMERLEAFQARAFEEKPDLETARRYLEGGEHYWNSGIFVWRAATVLALLERHKPGVRRAVELIAAAWGGPNQERVLREEYARVERISIDYAVLEKAEDIVVLEADFEWNDVGSWTAVTDLFGQDPDGNTVQGGPFIGHASKDCLVFGTDGRLVALVGVEGLVVVQTRDATLVCSRERAEEVKALLKRMEQDPELQAYT